MSADPHKHSEKLTPAGPDGHFYFGCLSEMRKDPMGFFTAVALDYGGIARIRFGRGNYSYLVSDPELIRELLIDNASKYTKNVRYDLLRKVLGEGLLLSEGDVWKRQRKIVRPAFHPKEVFSQVTESAEVVARFLDRFDALVESNEVVDVEPILSQLAQLLAGSWIMGEPFRRRADRIAGIYQDATEAWPEAPRSALAAYLPPSLPKALALRRCFKDFNAQIYEIIEDFRRGPKEECGLMSLLTEGHYEQTSKQLSDDELRDQLVTLFLAAHETSGSSLCWTHYLLSLHPKVRDAMQSEVADVLGGELPTSAELMTLPYLEQVINESLRLYSPIHSLSRVAAEENTIGGYTIPKGATVIVSLYATHRLPQYWENPDVFDPERFSEENVAKRPNSAFIPFATGHRSCIGGMLASLQSKMVVSQIAQRYDLNLLPGHPVDLKPSTTARPRYGLKMTVKKASVLRRGAEDERRLANS